MDGGLHGAASAFWSTASQGEVVSFFRHLGEDVGALDDAGLQVAGRLARERLPRLSDRAVARWLAGEPFPFVSPSRWDSQRFMQRVDLPASSGAGFVQPLSPVPGGGSQQPAPGGSEQLLSSEPPSRDDSDGRDELDGFLSDSEPVSSQLQREAAQAGRDLAHERSALGSEFWNEDADDGAGCGINAQSDVEFARRVAKQERDSYLAQSAQEREMPRRYVQRTLDMSMPQHADRARRLAANLAGGGANSVSNAPPVGEGPVRHRALSGGSDSDDSDTSSVRARRRRSAAMLNADRRHHQQFDGRDFDAGGGSSGSAGGTGSRSAGGASGGTVLAEDISQVQEAQSARFAALFAQQRKDFEAQLATQAAAIADLRDPRKRFEEMQRFALEPAMQAIIQGKLTAVQLQRMRAYRIDDSCISKLIDMEVLPDGWKSNDIFGAAALREHLPKPQRLPMSDLDRAVLLGECPYPENFPERARDYSHISDTEWKLLASDKQKAVHKANDSIQSALGELKDLVFICAALADDSLDPQDRCDIALRFAAIQSRFIFDEIAKCELRKMEIASVSLTGGKKVPVRKEDKGPDILGQDQRDAIDLANQTVHDVATVRKDWATIAGKPPTGGGGGGKPGGGKPGGGKPGGGKQGGGKPGGGKPGGGDKPTSGGGSGKRCFNCGKDGHVSKDCTAPKDAAVGKCHQCGKSGHKKKDCPDRKGGAAAGAPAPAPAPKPAGEPKPGKSPSHERDGYTPGAAKDPTVDKQARQDAASRHVQRSPGGQ